MPIKLQDILIVSTALFLSIAIFAQDATDYETFKNWTIRVDHTLGNGCFLVSIFGGETAFRLGFNQTNDSTYLMMANQNWRSIEAGSTYDLRIKFGDETPWSAQATGGALDDGTPILWLDIGVSKEDVSLFLSEFRDETDVLVTYEGTDIAFLDLSGSSEATKLMLDCQAEQNKINRDPFAKAQEKGKDPFANSNKDPFNKN